jgi:hypothetical protein
MKQKPKDGQSSIHVVVLRWNKNEKRFDMNEFYHCKTMEVNFLFLDQHGAKSGINFDPNDPRKRVLQRWYKGISIIEKLLWNRW